MKHLQLFENFNSEIDISTRKVNTRFMSGNLDINNDIFYILVDKYGMGKLMNNIIDYNEAIYSDGFIRAIEDGKTPILDSEVESWKPKSGSEYHHLIYDDICYVVYFE
jgi:hypothetical protein